jgi:DNA-binding IclR family transcriptional regulator
VKKQDSSQGASGAQVPQYPIESVDNALKILLLLGERSELRLTEVGEYLEVASSTAHRLLAMLSYRGFVRQNARTKTYTAGTALTGVAFAILQNFDFRSALHPYLDKLNHALAETVHLGLLDRASVRYIDAIESPRAVRVASRLGRSLPAHCTSSGKAMLAKLPTEELRQIYPDEELPTVTEHSIATRAELEHRLRGIRERGYATSTEESEDGVSSVAVAFPYRGTPGRIAFNASVPSSRMSATDQQTIARALLETVGEAAEVLHG